MSNGTDSKDDTARENVAELFKTIIATSGIMLALLWGLTQNTTLAGVLTIIRYASIVLVVSTAASLLGLQFLVAELERNTAKITKVPTVAFSFIAAWICFLGGCILLIVAIYKVSLVVPSSGGQV